MSIILWIGLSVVITKQRNKQTNKQTNKHQKRETANSMMNLAMVMRNKKELVKSEALYRRALVVYQKLYGERNSNTLAVQHDFAVLLQEMKQYEEAETLLQRTYAERTQLLGSKNIDTLLSLSALATCLYRAEKDEASEKVFRDLLPRIVDLVGTDARQTRVVAQNYRFLIQDSKVKFEPDPLLGQIPPLSEEEPELPLQALNDTDSC